MAWEESLPLLKELAEAVGVAGFEESVREVMRRHLAGQGELITDGLGSLLCVRAGKAASPRVLLAGHMDEVGLMVSLITDDGFLRFQTLGGWWEPVLLAQRVVVVGRLGPVPGVIGSRPPHLLSPEERKKPLERKEMFIDVGAASREEALRLGIRPGDPVVVEGAFTPLAGGKRVLARALDNRVGCAVAVEVMRRLRPEEHPNTLMAAGTVQEEVGLRGAATLAELASPDVAFALEVSVAGDTPGTKPEEAQSRLGKGPAITLYDATLIPHRRLRDFVVDVAERCGIPYQFDLMPGGGTDAGRFHQWRRGVPSLVIGVPTRYIHTGGSVMDGEDFEATVQLLVEVVRRLDEAAVEQLRRY